ncbi:MAG: gamma-glutamylcyclotransferase family protein [Opitutales bacterium]
MWSAQHAHSLCLVNPETTRLPARAGALKVPAMSELQPVVFVYGTLKPGGAYWQEYCAGRVVGQQAACVRGSLYDLRRGYPGLRRTGSGWVHGYRLTLADSAALQRIDSLEGYRADRPEEQNEYTRIRVACLSPQGERLGSAWTYAVTDWFWRRCDSRPLPDGEWPIEA